MSKLFIISQKNQQQTDAIQAGVRLAKQLKLDPVVTSYRYESLSGDAYCSPQITEALRTKILATDTDIVKKQLIELNAEHVQFHNVWCKNVHEHACNQAHPDKYAMILKSIHQSERFLPTDWQLIRHTPVPLLLMSNHPLHGGQSIVMALDLGSNNSSKQALNQAVIKQALQLAAATGNELHLGFVIRLPKVLRDMDLLNSHTLIKEAYRKHQQTIDDTGLDKDHVHIMVGDADLCIFELSCRLKAQYLVMGTRQRQGVMGYVIGNTAESILMKIRSNVLIVPHQDDHG